MQKFIDTTLDKTGKPVAGAKVLIITESGQAAMLYASADGSPGLTNPLTTNANGEFFFYAANGRYNAEFRVNDVIVATRTDILLYDPADDPDEVGQSVDLAPINSAIQALSTVVDTTVEAVELLGQAVDERATLAQLAASSGASLVGFQQIGTGAVARTVQAVLQDVVSVKCYGAVGDGVAADTAAIQSALNSGAKRVVGLGGTYRVTTLIVPAGVTFDGQGGELLTSGSNVQDVIVTGGTNVTVANWSIRSNVPGTRKARYGVLVAHANAKLLNLSLKDIIYTAVFNDAEGTKGVGITAENCGWDAVSNYQNAKNSTFRDIKGIRNGRSLFSTDAGARGIVLDGFESIDNGLDEITSEHKDVLHFEFATDCVFKNGVIRYTSGYTGGTISQTWAMMRWNASTNCHIQNVDIKVESSVNGKLLLGLIDSAQNGTGNVKCSASNINVDAEAIPTHALRLVAYDGNAKFRMIGGIWRGNVGILSGTAGGFAYEHIANIDAVGPGTGTAATFMSSQYVTFNWVIEHIKLVGFTTAYDLNGFIASTVRNGEVHEASVAAFRLLNSNAGAGYQPNGGAITGMVIRGTTGAVLKTNNQQTRSLVFSHNAIDGSATVGLDTTGGTAGATTASVKAMGNITGGAITTAQTGGTNTPGALNANMNNLSQ